MEGGVQVTQVGRLGLRHRHAVMHYIIKPSVYSGASGREERKRIYLYYE